MEGVGFPGRISVGNTIKIKKIVLYNVEFPIGK